jgi:WD40 repeat protein
MKAIMTGKLLKLTITIVILSASFACTTNVPKKPDSSEHEEKLTLSYGSSGAAFSPDGELLALANRDRLWLINTRSLQVIKRIGSARFGSFGNSKGLLFIDKQRLLIGIPGGIVLFDLADKGNSDKYLFASTSYIPRTMTWSAATKTLAFSTSAMPQSVNLVKISSTGFGSSTAFPGFNHVPADLVFSDDGKFLAATGDENDVLIYEVSNGDLVGELPTKGYVSELARFGDNQLLVAGADLSVWSFYSETEIAALEDPDLKNQIDNQIAARVAGATALGALTLLAVPLAIISGNGDAIWGLGEATYRAAISPVHTSPGDWCGRNTDITRDGKLLADVYPGITREVIRIIDAESGELLKTINPPGDYSCNVKFSPDGKQLLITSSKVARIYNTETWRPRSLRPD